MRVLHVVKKFPPLVGGDATAVAALARAQRRAGDDVEVLTSNPPAVRGTEEEVEDAHVHRVGPPQTSAQLDRITFRRARGLVAMRSWMDEHLGSWAPDVVHAHAVDVGYAVSSTAKAHGIPTVLTCHGVWFPVHGRRSGRGRIEVALLRRGGHHAVTAVDGASVAALASIGITATVVPNGVDVEEFAGEARRGDTVRFLFAGRHEPQKGLDVLLEAVPIARRDAGAPFVVDVVGDGELTADLRTDARSRGLDGVVRFPGRLSRADLVAAFRSADAFVLPSRYEGFPVTILEAWAARLPVIATMVGGISEVCTGENAVLVRPNDAHALAAAIIGLVQDPARRERLGRSGHELVRTQFSWDAVARRYREVYAFVG